MYFFTVTNTAAFVLGGVPILEQRGPYCYEITKEKVGSEHHISYTFSKQLSMNLTEDDVIEIINVPLLVMERWYHFSV